LGNGKDGKPVYLKDIWPAPEEVEATLKKSLAPDMFRKEYGDVFHGDELWRAMKIPETVRYAWDDKSTYIKRAPYFDGMPRQPAALTDIKGGRALAVFGDSITTDHISPAGNIAATGPAGTYLQSLGVKPADFNSYGARRGNHEVMVRGTFANIRIKNLMAPGTEGGVTLLQPSGDKLSIYDAAMKYAAAHVPLVILAGKEYGSGSSRDWAAKGPKLLGVRAVIAESFERIHRSNLVGMGVLPLQFAEGDGVAKLGLTGKETFEIEGIASGLGSDLTTGKRLTVKAGEKSFQVLARIDTPDELEYFKHGGILPYVLRQLLEAKPA
jgi:aconitate hydratase